MSTMGANWWPRSAISGSPSSPCLPERQGDGSFVFKYTYSADGNQLTKTDKRGTQSIQTSYTYDGLNRLTGETKTGENAFNSAYTYDSFSNRSQAALDGVNTSYTYDAANRLLSTTGGNAATYTYDDQGNMTQMVLTVGDTTRTVNCTYDGFNRLKKFSDNSGETVYTYDADGLRASKTTDAGTEKYVYDNGQLVVTLVPPVTQLYSGTVPASETATVPVSMIVGQVYYVEVDGTLYSAVGGTWSQDDVNLTAWPTDGGDEKPEVPPVDPDPDDPPAQLGAFVGIVVGDVTIVGSDRGETSILEGPAGATVTIYNNDPTRVSASYVRGLNLIASVKDGQATYYHYNAHGDVVQLTDSTGALVKDYAYDAFGVEQNASDTDANPFRYCGEQFDAETGDYYLRARYYTPGVGRFTQEDPIRDGSNWYAYCAGNPVMRMDPSGLWWNPIEEFAEWFAGWINGMYDATAGAAGGFFAETITSPFQDNGSDSFKNGNLIGKITTKFVLTHDIVYDFSLSAGVGEVSGTLGYSFIQGNASGYTAEYIHVGGGYSPGVFPVSGSVGIGFVENAANPEDYAGFFIDGSISGLSGMEYCAWPQGASAMSIIIGTNVSAGVRLDHYFLIKSEKSSTAYYDLYKKRVW